MYRYVNLEMKIKNFYEVLIKNKNDNYIKNLVQKNFTSHNPFIFENTYLFII